MVLVFAEHQNGQFKKAALEAVTYGYKTAQLMGLDCAAIVLGGAQEAGALGAYGASKVYQVADERLNTLDSQVYTSGAGRSHFENGSNRMCYDAYLYR
jgi:electron transfer flavoprotein alpha subunit